MQKSNAIVKLKHSINNMSMQHKTRHFHLLGVYITSTKKKRKETLKTPLSILYHVVMFKASNPTPFRWVYLFLMVGILIQTNSYKKPQCQQGHLH